jgi:hypothetical protein
MLEVLEATYVLCGRLDIAPLIQYIDFVEEDGISYATINPHYETWNSPEGLSEQQAKRILMRTRDWLWDEIRMSDEAGLVVIFHEGIELFGRSFPMTKRSYETPILLYDGVEGVFLSWFRTEAKIAQLLERVPEEIRLNSYGG